MKPTEWLMIMAGSLLTSLPEAPAQTSAPYSILYTFSARVATPSYQYTNADGAFPKAALIQASDGNFYGTTSEGGLSGYGTVFRFTPSGTLTTLASFDGSNGRRPESPLVLGRDGNFYGTTANGGGRNVGAFYRITPQGDLNMLHAFGAGADGKYPAGALAQDNDGNLFGTAQDGGANNAGTVFKVSTNGDFTTLFSFANSDGAHPYGGLTRGTDGNFYGTTDAGGNQGAGTVFRITPAGELATLVSFNYANGFHPEGSLVQSSDGLLYGTTRMGGAGNSTNGYGTVFRITPQGSLTTMALFDGITGSLPSRGLLEGSDGCFYGVSDFGGAFRMNANGRLTVLVSFNGGNGRFPLASLVQGTDGNYYGSTEQGASLASQGCIYRIDLRPSPEVRLTDGKRKLSWSGVPGLIYQAEYTTNLGSAGWAHLGGEMVATNQVLSAEDTEPADPYRFYRILLKP